MVKPLSKILYHGVKIFISSVRKSIQQEIELSRTLAQIRYQTQKSETEKASKTMSLQEAQQVLNIAVLGVYNFKFKTPVNKVKGFRSKRSGQALWVFVFC